MDLTNHFLIAMPSLNDTRFERSVVFICEHNEDGAMGLIINHPVGIEIGNMLKQINIHAIHPQICPTGLKQAVLDGGPVSTDRGFVLHTPKDTYQSSIEITDNLSLTTSKDILTLLGTEAEPKQYLVALGYSGWSAGQLEQEILDNAWLTIPATPELLFDCPITQRWKGAVQSLGIDIAHLSTQAGHA